VVEVVGEEAQVANVLAAHGAEPELVACRHRGHGRGGQRVEGRAAAGYVGSVEIRVGVERDDEARGLVAPVCFWSRDFAGGGREGSGLRAGVGGRDSQDVFPETSIRPVDEEVAGCEVGICGAEGDTECRKSLCEHHILTHHQGALRNYDSVAGQAAMKTLF